MAKTNIVSNQYLSVWTPEKFEEVKELYQNSTLSLDEISKQVGLTHEQIRNKMKKSKITRQGSQNPHLHKEGVNILLDWTPEFAWWLGWFLSDGSLSGEQFKMYNTEREVVEKMKQLIKSENVIMTMPKHDSHIGDKPVYCFSFRNKKLIERLAAMGVTKARDYVPDMPKEMIPHFIRGFFEGDGSFGVSIWTVGGKKAVIDKVQNLIKEYNPAYEMRTLRQRKDCADFWNLNICGHQDVTIMAHMMYQDKGENYLEYKYEKAVDLGYI